MEVMCTVLEVKFDIISLVVSSHWLLSRVFQQAEAEAFFFFFSSMLPFIRKKSFTL